MIGYMYQRCSERTSSVAFEVTINLKSNFCFFEKIYLSLAKENSCYGRVFLVLVFKFNRGNDDLFEA